MEMIVIGTIPAIFVGLLFQDNIEMLFSNTKAVGVFLVITGLMNYFMDKIVLLESAKKQTGKDSFLIGIAQSVAILPGISRSGSTIFAGLKLGLNKKDATEFSFLLSIPAVVGANLLQITKYSIHNIKYSVYVVGFLSAFISGYLAIKLLMKLFVKNRFKHIAFYCVIVGIVALVL